MRDTNVIVEAVRKADRARTSDGSAKARAAQEAEQDVIDGGPRDQIVKLNEAALFESRVVAALRKDTRVEPYHQLRTQVLKVLGREGWRTLAVTAAEDGGGSTLTAVNLAISLAQDVNHNVVLIDLNLRNPSIHRLLGLEPKFGILDYLVGKANLDEIVVEPEIPRLRVLPGRSHEEHSSALLNSPRMNALLGELLKTSSSTILIFDLPSLLHTDEAVSFAPTADATLLVIEEGGTTDEELKQSLQLLHDVNVIGTVLNKARG